MKCKDKVYRILQLPESATEAKEDSRIDDKSTSTELDLESHDAEANAESEMIVSFQKSPP